MDKQRARRSASIPVRIGHAAAWAAGLWKQEHLRTLITGVQRFVLCAVLAQGTILGGYMPFGLAMTAALMARGAGLSALGGLVCGVMLRGDGFHGGIYAAAALLVLCVMSVCAGLRVMSERWFAPGVATFASAACTFVFLPLGAELTAPAVLTFLLVQGITFGVCWMYGAAFAPPRDENDWRRPVTLLVLTATVLLSLSGINLFGVFAPARAGAAAGVAFGAAMDLNIGYGALFTCCYGLEIVEILSGREYIARIIRNQRVFPQTGHMQSAHCHAVAADLHIRPGDLIMHHACIVHQQIPGLNDHLFIVDQILARSAADQNQLDKILVCVHHTRVRARIRPDLADIKQLGMILAGITENRLYFLFYKTLHIQARLEHVWLRSSLFPQIITA